MIISLTGANDYQTSAELRRLTKDFIATYTDMGVERYDGDELDARKLVSILQAMPFLVDKRLVILRQPSTQKSVQEALEQLLDEVAETTELIIVEPKPDKRTSYYKALQKKTDLREYKMLDDRELAAWAVAQVKQAQGSLSPADAQFLVQRVGLNQMGLFNELQKLLAYSPQITKQSILELTEQTPQSSTFDLLDAALNGQQHKLVQLYREQRQQKVEPLAILGLLAWQLHVLAVVKAAGAKDSSELASQAKLNPFVVRKTQAVARHCSLAQVKQWVSDAAQLDVRLKQQPIDADEALLFYLFSFSREGTTSS